MHMRIGLLFDIGGLSVRIVGLHNIRLAYDMSGGFNPAWFMYRNNGLVRFRIMNALLSTSDLTRWQES